MLSEQKKWLFTSLTLLLRKHAVVETYFRSKYLKQLQVGYGYLTQLLVIAVVSLVSFLGLSQQAQAHTTITKTTSTPTVAPGGTATYTINVTDAGTSSATTGITVTDTLPTGFTYLSTQSVNTTVGATRPTTVNPTVGSNTPSWGTFNTPVAGTPASTFNITFSALVPIGGTCGKYDNAVTATATGGTHTYVPYTGTSSTAEDVTVTGSLSASKTTSTPTVVNTPTGTQATYTIVLSNTGQCTIPNVSITDTLPTGFTYASTGTISFTGSATRPTTTNPTAGATAPVWSNFTIPSGGSVSLTFTTNIANSVVNGTYNNDASANTTTAGITVTPYVGTSSTLEDVTVTSADLTITKTHTGNFTQGQTGATYTLTATNSGNAATSGIVSVVDTLPTGLIATAISGTGWTCTLGTLTCTRSDVLAAGSSYPTITLTVNVAANAASSVTNNASVSGGGEINAANDTATNPTTINTVSDLTITKTHTGNFTQGQTGATYTLTATNSGTLATSGTVSVVDTLPTGLIATAISGTGWTCTLGTLTCTRSDALAAGSSYPVITLTVNVAANAASSVTNNASVSGGGEINTANDTATNPTTINTVSDLTITKSHTGNFTQGQTGATYTLTATNSGTAATSGTVSVVDTLPTGLTATAISGTGWTCTLGTLTCTRSDALAAGSSYPVITLTVNVAANAASSITNNATVSGGGEINTANDTATDPTTVNGVSDLTITKMHTGSFIQGQTGASYTLTATNSGTATTSGTVTVVDTLPTGLTATATSGTGWTCSLNTPSLGKVQCTRSNALASGSSYPAITLTVNVSASVPVGTNSITNSASVSGGGETNTTNNSATDPTTVTALADLRLSKTATPANPSAGGSFNYTITVTNDGPSTATNVQVTDRLPPVTDILVNSLLITTSQGSAVYNNVTTPNIVWTVGSLAPNTSATLTIPATRLIASFTVNVAEVTASDQSDPDSIPSNNVASEDDQASVTVPSQSIDLAVAKSVNNPTPSLGQSVVFTVSVTNTSTSFTATGVGISDALPAGLTYQSSTTSQGTYTSGTGVWSVGSLSTGTTATLTITATVNASGTIINTAQLSALDQTDPNSANNNASATVTPAANNPKLLLVKRITAINTGAITSVVDPNTTADPNDNEPNWPSGYLQGAINGGTVRPGDEVEYTIYFLSSGDSPVANAHVCDLVPANSTFNPSIFNGLTPTDGGLPGADSGMALAIGSTTTYLTNAKDTDRGEFFVAGSTPTINCSGTNNNGAVVVNIVSGAATLPNATTPGTPNNSHGFIRFRAKVN